MPGRTPKPPTPRCTAAVFAERIILDQTTGFPTLQNCFSTFRVPSEPGRSAPFALFVQLTDGFGEYQVAAALHNLDEGGPLAQLTAPVRLDDRLQKANVTFAFGPVEFTHLGRYDLIVSVDGVCVMELTIDVELIR